MHLFVDCEFTDFLDCELISIALVANDGREFYGERSDFARSRCSAFVCEAVLPQLGQFPGQVFSREALRTALLAWLEQFADEPERLLCFDYGGDWELLVDLVGEVPPGWEACNIALDRDVDRLEGYFLVHGGRHHALYDARALKLSYEKR